MIEFSCPDCGKYFRVKDSLGGKTATCKCGNSVQIPEAEDDGFVMMYDEPERTMTPKAIGLMVGAIVALMILAIFFLKRYGAYKTHVEYINTLNLFTDAKSDFNHGDYDKALEKIETVIETRPSWDAPYLQGGVTSIHLEDWDKASQYFKKVTTLPDARRDYRSCALTNLAFLELRKDPPDTIQAESLLQQAVDLNTATATPRLMLAAMSMDSGKTAEAKKLLIAVEQDRKDLTDEGTALYALLRMRLAAMGDDADEFVKTYREARKHPQPQSFRKEATVIALRLLMGKESFDPETDKDLLDMAENAMKIADDNNKAALQTAFGKLMYSAGNYAEAAERLDPVIDENTPPDLIYLLAETHAQLADAAEKESERARHLKKTLELYLRLVADPAQAKRRGAGLMTSTIALCDRLGQEDKANELLEQAIALYPTDARLHLRKGRLLFRQKQYAEGLRAMEKSLSLDPTQEDLRAELEGYQGVPTFDDFRPAKPRDFVPRPLIHIRVNTGSPFPIDKESVRVTLDGKLVEHAMGGNEVFYVPTEELSVGKHPVHITAADSVGNSAEATFHVPIDGTPPKAELIEPRGPVDRGQPEFRLRLYDEMTMVDRDTVFVFLKNAQGNPNFLSMTLLSNGEYRQESKEFGFGRGDQLADPEAIRFRPSRRLDPGQYEIHIRMKDVAGFEARETLRFTVK